VSQRCARSSRAGRPLIGHICRFAPQEFASVGANLAVALSTGEQAFHQEPLSTVRPTATASCYDGVQGLIEQSEETYNAASPVGCRASREGIQVSRPELKLAAFAQQESAKRHRAQCRRPLMSAGPATGGP